MIPPSNAIRSAIAVEVERARCGELEEALEALRGLSSGASCALREDGALPDEQLSRILVGSIAAGIDSARLAAAGYGQLAAGRRRTRDAFLTLLGAEWRWCCATSFGRLPGDDELDGAAAYGWADARGLFLRWGDAVASSLADRRPQFLNLRRDVATLHAETGATRFHWDFKLCSDADGWHAHETENEGFFFGIWSHPDRRQLVLLFEGDVFISICLSNASFTRELERMRHLYGQSRPRAAA